MSIHTSDPSRLGWGDVEQFTADAPEPRWHGRPPSAGFLGFGLNVRWYFGDVQLTGPDNEPVQLDLIEQVYFPLGRCYRFNNQVDWTVLQHSCLVTRLLETGECGALTLGYAATHDWSEVLTGDLATPIKRLLGCAWGQVEDEAEAIMHAQAGLPGYDGNEMLEDIRRRVKDADREAGRIEAKVFDQQYDPQEPEPGSQRLLEEVRSWSYDRCVQYLEAARLRAVGVLR